MSYETDIYATPAAEGQVFSINHEHLIFHDTQMEVRDISGICYGFRYGQGSDLIGYGHYVYQFVDTSSDVISFTVSNDPATAQSNLMQHNQLEHAIWLYAGNALLNKIVRAIHGGQELKIAHLTLNTQGIHFDDQPYISARRNTIPWREAAGVTQHGVLFISSFYNSSLSTSLNVLAAYNAVILQRILQYLVSNKYLIEVLSGTQPPLA
jgi:hypothetical protein